MDSGKLASTTTQMSGLQEGELLSAMAVRAYYMLMEIIQHRRTGLTLKEGRRDEHGMEEVEGLFSSPEKSPAKLNGFDEEEEEEDDRGSNGSEMSIEYGECEALLF